MKTRIPTTQCGRRSRALRLPAWMNGLSGPSHQNLTFHKQYNESSVPLKNKMSTRSSSSSSSSSSQRHSDSDTSSTHMTSRDSRSSCSHRDPIFRYSSLTAGIASGIVSSLVVAPLDLIRTRLQVFHHHQNFAPTSTSSSAWRMLRDIIHREGVKGCFRGLTTTLITVPVFWGVYCAYT